MPIVFDEVVGEIAPEPAASAGRGGRAAPAVTSSRCAR